MRGDRVYTALSIALVLVAVFAVPITHAAVVITEIMYDPFESSDHGREWIEIQNTGDISVAVKNIRFVEAGSKHYIRNDNEEDSMLAVGEIAVITQNPEIFRDTYPAYTKKVLRSNFSLRQKDDIGERLEIYNIASSSTDFATTYTPDSRTNGTGATLHITSEGQIPAPATPGEIAINPVTVTNREPTRDKDSSTTAETKEAKETPSAETDATTEESAETKTINQLGIQVQHALQSIQPTVIETDERSPVVQADAGMPITSIPTILQSSKKPTSQIPLASETTEKLLFWIVLILLFIALELLAILVYLYRPRQNNTKTN